jgi:putative cardiolipin synthase
MLRWIWSALVLLSLLGPGLAWADDIEMYSRGDKSLAAHLVALDAAKTSIDLLTFEFAPCDSSTKLIMNVLKRKAKEGVQVRVIVDDYLLNPKLKSGLAAYFRDLGIKFRIYNQNAFLGANHRSHIKLLLVDGTTYFADSSNYTDAYFGMDAEKNYINRDFKVSGASGAQVVKAFAMILNSGKVSEVRNPQAGDFLTSCLKRNSRDEVVARYFNENGRDLSRAGKISCKNIQYLADDPKFLYASLDDKEGEDYMNERRLKLKASTSGFLAFITNAKKTLNLENQYYIPTYKVRQAVNKLKKENRVHVLVLTNSTADGTNGVGPIISDRIVNDASRDTGGIMNVLPLSAYGMLRTEHVLSQSRSTTPWYLHSKTGVRDHKDVWFGSYNIDPRSYHSNLEYGVLVSACPELASEIESDYQKMVVAYESDERSVTPELNPLDALRGFLLENFL